MPPKKGTKAKGKQAEEKVEKVKKKEPIPPPAPSSAREPTPAPPAPDPEPLPVPAPVTIAVTEHEARQHEGDDDVHAFGHDQSEEQGEDGGWDDAGAGGSSNGGGGWGGGDDGWGETGDTGGSEFDEVDDGKNAGTSGESGKPSAPVQEWPSPSQQPGALHASLRTAPTPAPPPSQHAAPSQPHDWSAAQHSAAPPQGQNPPPLTQPVYTSASAMANRGAHSAAARTEQRIQDQRLADLPSYYWAPNQAAPAKQTISSTTTAPQKAQMPPLSAWGEPKSVDPWGSPRPQPKPLPAPAKALPRQAWQDWGRQAQPALARAPHGRNQSTPPVWSSTYDDDEYSEDEESDETYTDPRGGRWARVQPGWGKDPRKQPKVTFASMGSDNGMGAGTKPVLSPQEHSQILKSWLNELPQSQPGHQQWGHHPHKSAGPNPHHRHSQPQPRQAIARDKHASQDGGKKSKKQQKQKGGGWEDDGWGAGDGDGDGEGWDADANGWGAGADTWEGGGGGGGKRKGGGGGDYDGWHDGGGDGWDKVAGGDNNGWDQNDAWESHDNSWSNTKGSANDWGANDDWGAGKGSRGTGDDGWGKDDGWGEQEDGWDEEENEWEETRRYQHVDPSNPKDKYAWGGSQTESHYFMPSKTLSHAIKGTQLKATNGVPPNKMDEYTNVKFVESRNAAFAPVERAIFGRERKAKDRIHWMFSPNKDDRVSAVLAWIQAMEYNIGSFGLHKFLQTRERGALFVNVTFRVPDHPKQPVFDWLTFDELQSSTDRILQESVLSYDPAMQVIVFIYLPSPTGNSVAMWRRKVLVPNNTRLRFQKETMIAKGGLRRDKDYVVYIDEMPPRNSGKAAQAAGKQAPTKSAAKKAAKQTKPAPKKSALVKHQRGQSLPAIPDLTAKPKKKRKWWQILRFED